MSVNISSSPAARRLPLGPLWIQVLVGMCVGILAGIFLPHQAVALRPLGDLFVRLIRMTLPPLMFLSICIGIARLGNLKEAGRIGAKTLVYFEVVSTLALLVGMGGCFLLHPGAGMNINPASFDTREIADYAGATANHGVADFLINIIPTSFVGAFVNGNMLQVVFLSILSGMALAGFREQARPLLDIMDLCLRAVFGVVGFIISLAPIAVLGAIAFTVGQYGIATLMPLAKFVAAVWIVCTLFTVVVMGAIARLADVNLFKLLRYLREEILMTLGTSCSEAVMAPCMVKLERMGCQRPIVEMVFPTSYAFNADGTAIFVAMGTIFIAQAIGVHLAAHEIALLLLTMMLVSKGISGVTSAALVVLAAVLASSQQIPLAGMVLLLGVDRLTTPIRAALNVIGNSVATVVIARWEHAYDHEVAERVLSGREGRDPALFEAAR
jgi:aerobic C4-dicarboxylate transport protein